MSKLTAVRMLIDTDTRELDFSTKYLPAEPEYFGEVLGELAWAVAAGYSQRSEESTNAGDWSLLILRGFHNALNEHQRRSKMT